jgi:hypothetical protein
VSCCWPAAGFWLHLLHSDVTLSQVKEDQ